MNAFHLSGMMSAAAVALAGAPSAAWADDESEVYDEGARAVAAKLKPGSILLWYCESCSQSYEVKYLVDWRVVPAGPCLARLETRAVTLFTGQATSADHLDLKPADCQVKDAAQVTSAGSANTPSSAPAFADLAESPAGFSYSFRATRDPLLFVGFGRDTVLAAQFDGKFRLTKADRRAIDSCAAPLLRQSTSKSTAVERKPARLPPNSDNKVVAEIRPAYDAVRSGQAQPCALSSTTAGHLARFLKTGVTVVDPYDRKTVPKKITIEPDKKDLAQFRVLTDGVPFDTDSMLFLRSDGQLVFAAALFGGCSGVSSGYVCLDAAALGENPEPEPPPCNIDYESDCQ